MEPAVGPYHFGTSLGSVKARQTAARGARKVRSSRISVSEGRLSVEAPWVLAWAMDGCITSWLHNHLVMYQTGPRLQPGSSPHTFTAGCCRASASARPGAC